MCGCGRTSRPFPGSSATGPIWSKKTYGPTVRFFAAGSARRTWKPSPRSRMRGTRSASSMRQNSAMAKLRHLAITVPDPEKAAEFYMQAFGLRRVGSTDWHGASGVYLTDGVMTLALLRYRKEKYAGKRGSGYVGAHHFGFLFYVGPQAAAATATPGGGR